MISIIRRRRNRSSFDAPIRESYGSRRPRFLLGLALIVFTCGDSSAQNNGRQEKTPKAEDHTRVTKDGVKIYFRYYPGTKGEEDQKPVPIILLHGWGQRGSDLEPLAKYLQDPNLGGDDAPDFGGHAVIVPDLRGHGRSTSIASPTNPDVAGKLDPDKMKGPDLVAMVQYDMEAIKSFLVKENNAGKLNIEQLCIVAIGESSLVALNWCVQDWSWRRLAGFKQGRDVKAFVLVSPVTSFRGFSAKNALRHPIVRERLSAMIFYGAQDRKAKQAGRAVYAPLKKMHRIEFDNKQEMLENRDLFERGLPTTLQGTKLLTAPGLNVAQEIALFIDLRLVRKADDFPWAERRSPIQDD